MNVFFFFTALSVVMLLSHCLSHSGAVMCGSVTVFPQSTPVNKLVMWCIQVSPIAPPSQCQSVGSVRRVGVTVQG